MAKNGKSRYVIIRTYSAGVHFGELASRTGKEVVLKNARRLWYWKGANTLNEVSLRGVTPGSRVSETVPLIVLTEAIEILPCTPIAARNLKEATWT